jgi:hypothetical protein
MLEVNVELHIKTIHSIIDRAWEVKNMFDKLDRQRGCVGLLYKEYLAEWSSALVALYKAQAINLMADKTFDANIFVSNNKKLLNNLDKAITPVGHRFKGKYCIAADNSTMYTWMKAEGCFNSFIIVDCVSNLDGALILLKEVLNTGIKNNDK